MSTLAYFRIDDHGRIVEMFDKQPPTKNNDTIIHASTPPKSMLKPRWVGSADSGRWTDAATRTEHESYIDEQTDAAIQNWTREKGKNEAYYINCGIRVCIQNITDTTNIDYRHYHEYRAFVDAQKKLGKAKKDALS